MRVICKRFPIMRTFFSGPDWKKTWNNFLSPPSIFINKRKEESHFYKYVTCRWHEKINSFFRTGKKNENQKPLFPNIHTDTHTSNFVDSWKDDRMRWQFFINLFFLLLSLPFYAFHLTVLLYIATINQTFVK